MELGQEVDYYGIKAKLIDLQPCMAKILLPTGYLWVSRKTIE